jgi:hypothetical protein
MSETVDIDKYCLAEQDEAKLLELSREEDVERFVLRCADEEEELSITIEALKVRIKVLQERARGMEAKCEKLRGIIQAVMQRDDWKKPIKNGSSTVTLADTAPDYEITNEADIPAEYWIPGDPKLDKKKLREAILEDGLVVPGTRRTNGGQLIKIRRK